MKKITSKESKHMLRVMRRERNLRIFNTDEQAYLDALKMVFGEHSQGCVLCGQPTKAAAGIVIDLDSFFCSHHCPVCELNEPIVQEKPMDHVEVSPPVKPVAILGPDGRDSGRTVFLRSDQEWPR